MTNDIKQHYLASDGRLQRLASLEYVCLLKEFQSYLSYRYNCNFSIFFLSLFYMTRSDRTCSAPIFQSNRSVGKLFGLNNT